MTRTITLTDRDFITDEVAVNRLVRCAPATDNLLELCTWLASNGYAHLSLIERIELAEKLTRRRFIIGAGALGIGVLTGCGAPEEAAVAPTATVASSAYPRTITDVRGPVEIPARPARVLCASAFMDVATLLAFDLVPVAIRSYAFGLLPFYAERLNGRPAPQNLGYEPYNLELLTTLKLDLILMYEIFAGDEEAMTNLRQIGVPIVVIPNSGYRRQLEVVGAVLGEETKATALADELDARVAAFSPVTRPDSIAIFSVESSPGTVYLPHTDGPAMGFIEQIGLTYEAPDVDRTTGGFSMERLADIDAEFVLVQQFEREDAAAVIAANPLFQAVPAIAAGRFVVLSVAETWATETGDVLSFPYALDVMTRILSK